MRVGVARISAPLGDPFEALGDPHRRAIVELLGSDGRSVGEVADALPISRPAVSRHLRLLKEAGLVVEEPQGTRRIYRLHDQGVEAVETFLTQVWGDAATRFRLMAENTEPKRAGRRSVTVEPLRLSYDIACSTEHAFDGVDDAAVDVVAEGPFGVRASRHRRHARTAPRRPHLRAHARRHRDRLGRDHVVEPALTASGTSGTFAATAATRPTSN